MSTTQANLPVAGTQETPPRPAAPVSYGNPSGPAAHRLSRLWLLTPVVIIVLALTAFGLWRQFVAPKIDDNISLYSVKMTSFPIVLKEKGDLKAHKSVDIKCEIEGGSTIIWIIPEGTRVEKGDLLVELASDTIQQKIDQQRITVNTAQNTYDTARAEYEIQLAKNEADIDAAQTQLELAEIDLEKWKEGDRFQQKQEAALAVESAKSRLQQATEQLEVTERMFLQNYVTAVELEEDRLKKQEADFTLQNAEKALEVLKDYTFKKDQLTYESAVRDAKATRDRTKETAGVEARRANDTVKSAKDQLVLVQAELAKYEDQLAKAKILAPQPGLVVYYSESRRGSSTMIDAGAKVYQNQKMLELPDLSQMKMVVRIHEADAERIKPGLKALIKVAGIYEEVEGNTDNETRSSGAQKIFEGEVTKIAALADSRNRWLNPELREFETEITLTGSGQGLKPGVTAEAEIYVDQIDEVLVVPVPCIFTRSGRSYVFVDDKGRTPEYREVQLGASNTTFIEVTKNLTAGEKVWMTITDEMVALLPTMRAENGDMPHPPLEAGLQDGRTPQGLDATPRQGNRPRQVAGERPGAGERQGAGQRPGAEQRSGAGERQAEPSGEARSQSKTSTRAPGSATD